MCNHLLVSGANAIKTSRKVFNSEAHLNEKGRKYVICWKRLKELVHHGDRLGFLGRQLGLRKKALKDLVEGAKAGLKQGKPDFES